jgi:uncharacterized protein YdaU (DUF1376 family)
MSLPWFSFYTDDYLGNTMHLTTEEHGAYLLLMLTYYRTEKPLPGYDRALAGTARLPLDRWLIARVALEPFFKADGDVWRHDRIEAEIAERHEKHTKSSDRARHAALAKANKRSSEQAPSKPDAPPKRAPRAKPVSPEPTHLQLHLQTTLSNERVVTREAPKHDDDPPKAIEVSKEVSFNPLGTTLPESWIPEATDQATASVYGMNDDDLRAEVLTFHAYNAQHGTFSKNWSATWQMWCARWKEREAAKPKLIAPRVEVNNQPTPENWDRACKLWAKGGSSWSYKSLGPEPGQPGCKCPNIFLTKHNINPQTGLVAAPSKEPVS